MSKNKWLRLHGGRNTVDAKEIEHVRLLDTGSEAEVHKVRVTVDRHGRERSVDLAEKRFFPHHPINHWPWSYDKRMHEARLRRQFDALNNLSELNREKDLGLNIVPTFRLRGGLFKKSTFLLTLLDEATDLSEQENKLFLKDIKRQEKIARENGFIVPIDSFLPVRDSEKGLVAVIFDPGNLTDARARR